MTLAYAANHVLQQLTAAAFTWVAGPADATRAYLCDGKMDKVFTSGSTGTSTSVVIDMGAAVAISAWAVLNSNAYLDATPRLTITAADDAGMSVNLVTFKSQTTLNATAPKNKDHILQGAPVTKRYWKLAWAFASNHTLTIGEIYASVASFTLSRTGTYGDSGDGEGFITAQSKMQYGDTRAVYLAGPVRETHLKWDDHTSSNRDELASLWRLVKGPTTPFLWIPSYEAVSAAAAASEQEVIFGRLLLSDLYAPQSDFNLYQPPSFLIRSLGREVGA